MVSPDDEYAFEIERLGLATYFLALSYLALTVQAARRLYRVHSFLPDWGSTKLFYLAIFAHLFLRTVSWGVLCFYAFKKNQTDAGYRLLLIAYLLPEFLIISLYVLLFFHWLATFVVAHDQFLYPNVDSFHSNWKRAYAVLSILIYASLVVLYVMAQRDTIEYCAAFADLGLPVVFFSLWLYWSWCALAGFPYVSRFAEERVAKVNHVVLLWSIGRVARGAEFLISIERRWEEDMETAFLSMIVVGVLFLAEFMPLYYALDWSVVGPILMGEESQHLLTAADSSADLHDKGGGGGGGRWGDVSGDAGATPLALGVSRIDVMQHAVDPSEIKYQGEPFDDTGFSCERDAVWQQRAVRVTTYRFGDNPNAVLLDELLAEVIRHSSLLHPNIVPFLGVLRAPRRHVVGVVTERMAGGSLRDLLRESEQPFYPETVLRIARQLADALVCVHDTGFAHGSLGSDVIWLDGALQLKLGGLARARLQGYAELVLIRRMANRYSAPEVLRGSLSKKSDVYAFGLILWELVTRREWAVGRDMDELRKAVLRRGERPPLPRFDDVGVSVELLEIMKSCWRFDEAERPSSAQLRAALEECF